MMDDFTKYLPGRACGWIYLIRAGDHHKIGRASNVRKRLNSMQTGCPFKLVMEFHRAVYNVADVEQYLHLKYKLWRTTGEWFRFPVHSPRLQDIKDYLDSLPNPVDDLISKLPHIPPAISQAA